jgi:hypothetical protein
LSRSRPSTPSSTIACRHSEAQRVLLGRVLDEVEDLVPERSCPIACAIGASAQMFGVFEQIFGANHQILHRGGDYKDAQKPSWQCDASLRKRPKALIIEGAAKGHKP